MPDYIQEIIQGKNPIARMAAVILLSFVGIWYLHGQTVRNAEGIAKVQKEQASTQATQRAILEQQKEILVELRLIRAELMK